MDEEQPDNRLIPFTVDYMVNIMNVIGRLPHNDVAQLLEEIHQHIIKHLNGGSAAADTSAYAITEPKEMAKAG